MNDTYELFDMVFTKMYQAVDWMVDCYNRKDLARNYRNSGTASGCASVLRSLGYEVDLRIYNKDGYDLTDRIVVEGKTFDFFHK